MKILEIPFETIYKCDLCGCKFEIEPNDLSVEKVTSQTLSSDELIQKIIHLYTSCPYCDNMVIIKRKQDDE